MTLTSTEILVAVVLGLFAGFAGGLAGIGGSLIMLPGLALLLGKGDAQTQHLYMAAAMPVNALVALPATRQHFLRGAIDRRIVTLLVPATAVAVVVGVLFSNRLEGSTLRSILALFIGVYCAMNLWRAVRPSGKIEIEPGHGRASAIVGTGVATGLVAGLLGLGGGVVMVPALQVFARLDVRRAIAASAATMCVTAIIGAAVKLGTLPQHGFSINDALALSTAMGPSAILGSWVGATLTHVLPIRWVRITVSVILLAAAAKLAGWF